MGRAFLRWSSLPLLAFTLLVLGLLCTNQAQADDFPGDASFNPSNIKPDIDGPSGFFFAPGPGTQTNGTPASQASGSQKPASTFASGNSHSGSPMNHLATGFSGSPGSDGKWSDGDNGSLGAGSGWSDSGNGESGNDANDADGDKPSSHLDTDSGDDNGPGNNAGDNDNNDPTGTPRSLQSSADVLNDTPVAAVPEPSTFFLAMSGALPWIAIRRRRNP